MDQAQIVIIGGGAVGASALWHLTQMGQSDCLLIEKNELTSGSTWHAAGNCPNFSTSWNTIKLQRHSTRLYAALADKTGYPINYHITGSIRLAHTRDRMDEFAHVVSMAQHQGLDFALLSPQEIRERHPFIQIHDLLGGLWDPLDGDIDPSQLTQAFAAGARAAGARIERFTSVVALEQRADGDWIVTVQPDAGPSRQIRCQSIINAAGYRAGEVMALLGQHLPIVTMEHQYLVTEPIAALTGRTHKLPLLRDPDVSYYLRQERDCLLLGPYEWQATTRWQNGLPADFANQLFPDDLDRLEPYIQDAIARVPILGEGGVQRVINGPIPYSPDGNPYIGPAPGLPGVFHCNTFSFGIAQAGGAGKTVAEWVVHGQPEWDFWHLDPRRYTGYATRAYVEARAVELYQHEYAVAYPVEERPAGRPARTTPLYHHLAAKGAQFCARGGWERAAWFATSDHPAPQPARWSFRRGELPWFGAVAQECRAVREAVGILDLGGFTKLLVEGPGAAAAVDAMTCSRLPPPGRLRLTWILNETGGIVSEVTVACLAPDRFYLVSAAAAEWHDQDVIRQHLPGDGSARLSDHSAALGTLVVAGPHARTLLSRVTDADLSNDAFPWMSHREIEIGMARLRAFRVTYVGELGWELHVPSAHLAPTYHALWQAGADLGLRDFGMYAMDSLRLEKGYRGWKGDITAEYSPLRAGLERLVHLDKPAAFVGRQALLAERQRGPVERLVPLTLDDPGEADAPYCSTVWLNGERVGLTVSSGWGYTLNRSIALAYVRPDLATPGTALEVEILGTRQAATVGRDPLYDPDNLRIRA